MKKYLVVTFVALVFANTAHAEFDLSSYSRNTDDNTILLGTWDREWCDEQYEATYLGTDDDRGDCVINLEDEGNSAIRNAVIWSVTNNLLGMKLEEARERSREVGVSLRAANINGVGQDLTDDEEWGRIDVIIENDVVVRYSMGGVVGVFEKSEEDSPEPSSENVETELAEAEQKIALLQQIVALLLQLVSVQPAAS